MPPSLAADLCGIPRGLLTQKAQRHAEVKEQGRRRETASTRSKPHPPFSGDTLDSCHPERRTLLGAHGEGAAVS